LAKIRCGNQVFTDIRAVVFDKDGTLARSEIFLLQLAQRRTQMIEAQVPNVQAALLLAFGVKHDQIDPAGLMAVGTRLENETAAAAYVVAAGEGAGKGWIEALSLVRFAFGEADRQMPPKAAHTPLLVGAISLMQRCLAANIRLAILSSDRAANVEEFVSKFELQRYFQAIYGVDQRYVTKADPELLQRLFAALGAKPEQTLMIGDSEADAALAAQAGMAGCIGFTGGWTSAVAIPSATVLVDQFAQIEISL
jgi:phosphoglycolate phosphatase